MSYNDSGQFDALGPDNGDGDGGIGKWLLAQIIIGAIDWMLASEGVPADTIIGITIAGELISMPLWVMN